MSNTFSLDSFRAEVTKKFSPVVVELSDETEVELKALLRLGEKDRKAVVASLKDITDLKSDDEEEDDELIEEYSELICDAVAKVLKVIASSPRKLLAELDHEDPRIKAALHTGVIEQWMSGAQLGEA